MEYNPKRIDDIQRSLKSLQNKSPLFTIYNPKLLKGIIERYVSAALMLAPGNISGYEVCAYRTPGCTRACTNTSGQGGIVPGGAVSPEEVFKKGNDIQRARLSRTLIIFYKTNKNSSTPFIYDSLGSELIKEINDLLAWAKAHRFTAAFRLNGTSDLRWESMPVHARKNIMRIFPDTIFYDYTKWPFKKRQPLPPNYHLTYSWNEDPHSPERAAEYLDAGYSVAVVFMVRKGQPLPASFKIEGADYPVIDGDLNDLRFKDPKGYIIGLRAKGFGVKDTSGFVVRLNGPVQNPLFDEGGGLIFPDIKE